MRTVNLFIGWHHIIMFLCLPLKKTEKLQVQTLAVQCHKPRPMNSTRHSRAAWRHQFLCSTCYGRRSTSSGWRPSSVLSTRSLTPCLRETLKKVNILIYLNLSDYFLCCQRVCLQQFVNNVFQWASTPTSWPTSCCPWCVSAGCLELSTIGSLLYSEVCLREGSIYPNPNPNPLLIKSLKNILSHHLETLSGFLYDLTKAFDQYNNRTAKLALGIVTVFSFTCCLVYQEDEAYFRRKSFPVRCHWPWRQHWAWPSLPWRWVTARWCCISCLHVSSSTTPSSLASASASWCECKKFISQPAKQFLSFLFANIFTL